MRKKKIGSWHATSIKVETGASEEALSLNLSAGSSLTIIRILMNIVAALLSAILAFLLLSPILLLGYLALVSIMTAIFFTLRTRLLSRPPSRRSETSEEIPLEPEERSRNLRTLLLMFLIPIAVIVSPLLLAKILDPYIWFVLMVSLITGFSTAEIVFYLYTR